MLLFTKAHTFPPFLCSSTSSDVALLCWLGLKQCFFGCSSFSNGTLSFFPQILLLSLISTDFHQVSDGDDDDNGDDGVGGGGDDDRYDDNDDEKKLFSQTYLPL